MTCQRGQGNKQRALLLDRDGVINADHGYVCDPAEFEFIDGIFDLCRHAAALEYRIIVVTNQAGIGRGYYTEQQFYKLTEWMCQEFIAHGSTVNQVYFCPFHPEHGIGHYRRESEFRKPGPGMILQAAREHGLDLAASILIGDKESDVQAGLAAGVGINILFRQGGEEGLIAPATSIVVDTLAEAKKYLVMDISRHE